MCWKPLSSTRRRNAAATSARRAASAAALDGLAVAWVSGVYATGGFIASPLPVAARAGRPYAVTAGGGAALSLSLSLPLESLIARAAGVGRGPREPG